jgi:hypothetical protein
VFFYAATPNTSKVASIEETAFKARVVALILDHKAEEALELLADHYNDIAPKLEVGLPRGHAGVAGCYVSGRRTIYTRDGEGLSDPFLIIHEFYHHIRMFDGKHLGTEKYANSFAKSFIDAYRSQSARHADP